MSLDFRSIYVLSVSNPIREYLQIAQNIVEYKGINPFQTL